MEIQATVRGGLSVVIEGFTFDLDKAVTRIDRQYGMERSATKFELSPLSQARRSRCNKRQTTSPERPSCSSHSRQTDNCRRDQSPGRPSPSLSPLLPLLPPLAVEIDVEALSLEERMDFEHRSAILEFDEGWRRLDAEHEAWKRVLAARSNIQ